MERFYYAQLDSDNICISIADLSEECNEENVIQIEFFDATLLGKKYNNGNWEVIENEG